jgi:hypothetical protein
VQKGTSGVIGARVPGAHVAPAWIRTAQQRVGDRPALRVDDEDHGRARRLRPWKNEVGRDGVDAPTEALSMGGESRPSAVGMNAGAASSFTTAVPEDVARTALIR